MWQIANYISTALFSLKPSWATSSGGKSLLLPTPWAIKMALLDACCRLEGVANAESKWPAIRDRIVALRGPAHIVVTNTFTRILKPRRGEASEGKADAGPLARTIGFREYVFYPNPLGIALSCNSGEEAGWLAALLLQINYLGKRGGFLQLLSAPALADELPEGFLLTEQDNSTFDLHGTMQQLDDCGPEMAFEQANIYSGKSIRLGAERILQHIAIPYRLISSSKGYSLYQRIE